MVGDDRERRLLGLDRVAARQPQADRGRVEQPEHLLVLGLLGARGIAPRVAAALGGGMPSSDADPRVQPLGHPLGGLHAEAVDEQLLGELALGLEARHQLGHLVAGGDGLERDDVDSPEPDAAGRSRPGRSGRAWAGAGTRAARARAVGGIATSGSQTISSLPSELHGK